MFLNSKCSHDRSRMSVRVQAQVLGHDALRMRLRRMVETKPSGKCHVDESVRADYNNAERREWLEIALCDAIKKHGTDRKNFKKIRVGVYKPC